MLPVFVTLKVYGTPCPAAVIEVVVELFATFSAGAWVIGIVWLLL